MDVHLVSLEYAKRHSSAGWLVQIRNNGLFSPLIRVATGGPHTHSAMVLGHDSIGEVKEWVGPRITDFAFQHALYPGRIDFYAVAPEYHNLAGEFAAAEMMRRMATECQYDYRAIFRIALRHVPIVRWFVRYGLSDDAAYTWEDRRYCSEAVAAAYQYGLRDPVPGVPNRLVTPHDLSKSLMFRYTFTM